ncbi:unnamed protein product [Sympodiomycopsis kandeliae]
MLMSIRCPTRRFNKEGRLDLTSSFHYCPLLHIFVFPSLCEIGAGSIDQAQLPYSLLFNFCIIGYPPSGPHLVSFPSFSPARYITMSHFLTRQALCSGGASSMASTSAYTLSGWIGRQPSSLRSLSSTVTANATAAEENLNAKTEPLNKDSTTHYRITLRRSAIGLPSKTERIIKALGLKKRLSTVYHPHSSTVAGSILALKELIHVDNVKRLSPPVGLASEEISAWHESISDEEAIWVDANGDVVDWGREAKKAPRGYRVVGNLISEERDEIIQSRQQQE